MNISHDSHRVSTERNSICYRKRGASRYDERSPALSSGRQLLGIIIFYGDFCNSCKLEKKEEEKATDHLTLCLVKKNLDSLDCNQLPNFTTHPAYPPFYRNALLSNGQSILLYPWLNHSQNSASIQLIHFSE